MTTRFKLLFIESFFIGLDHRNNFYYCSIELFIAVWKIYETLQTKRLAEKRERSFNGKIKKNDTNSLETQFRASAVAHRIRLYLSMRLAEAVGPLGRSFQPPSVATPVTTSISFLIVSAPMYEIK